MLSLAAFPRADCQVTGKCTHPHPQEAHTTEGPPPGRAPYVANQDVPGDGLLWMVMHAQTADRHFANEADQPVGAVWATGRARA
jgi:hypothetical protein